MGDSRSPNFKLGWFVPNQIAALTHSHADVTPDDFMGVVQAGTQLLKVVDDPFHVLIDNRSVRLSAPATLTEMQQSVPYMSHPRLRWVVVVKPESLEIDTSSLPVEEESAVRLKNVSSLLEAVQFLNGTVGDLRWSEADPTFFPEADLTSQLSTLTRGRTGRHGLEHDDP